MRILVHSPWLPGYIDVLQTILIMLTMAGLFPDRPHTFSDIQMMKEFITSRLALEEKGHQAEE